MKKAILILFPLILSFFEGCTRLEVNKREDAMRKSFGPKPELLSLALAQWASRDRDLLLNIKWLEKRGTEAMTFGPCTLRGQDYADQLKKLVNKTKKDFINLLRDDYDFYEVYGKDTWGDILLTSYYSPVIKGSRVRSEKYSQPLYSKPDDLSLISLKDFIAEGILEEGIYSRGKLPALIVRNEKGDVKEVRPYYSRREIDEGQVLNNKGLELAYVDPVDAFFLHIQGSGNVEFENGELLSLGYDAQNGHKYYSIGKSLFDIIDKDEMSKDKLEGYLKRQSASKRNEIFFLNPSYVFFRKLNKKAGQTTFGPRVRSRRTLAVDYRVFPLGGIAFLDFQSPDINTKEELKEFSEDKLKRQGRFVLAHDSGGAIRGTGRADLYWGEGELASFNAGVMKHRARMWFLAPKMCGRE